jgi:hypothetical protein
VDWHLARRYVVLRALVPKNNEKDPQAAEHFFASLHGIFNAAAEYQETVSFEISALNGFIQFYVAVPEHLQNFVSGQLYAQYPTVEMEPVPDYTRNMLAEGKVVLSTELVTSKEDVYPIKTFVNFTVDPLAGITGVLAEASMEEQLMIQVLVRPMSDEWQGKGINLVKKIKAGEDTADLSIGQTVGRHFSSAIRKVARGMILGPNVDAAVTAKDEPKPLSAPVEAALKGVEEKITKLGFESLIRIVVVSGDKASAEQKLQSIVGAFQQFNTTNLNSLVAGDVNENIDVLTKFQRRFFDKGYVLNIEELASLYHFPNMSVETPRIVWAGSKKGEPPSNLPVDVEDKNITVFGETNFRSHNQQFGIKLRDRSLHMYAIGKTGTGKSTLLENMIIGDIRKGRGVAVVDPHGDLIKKVIRFIPKERINDIVIFDPSDREFPVAFNILENVDPDLKNIVASGVVGIFKKIFGESWGPRLEYILRNTVLALLDYEGATMLGILRVINDAKYRLKVIEKVQDIVIKDFFINEFEKYDQKFRAEAVAPIQNKVGQFLSSTTIRNIVGQPKSTINIEDIMNSGKILLLDLSMGKIGEDNSALLGAMMITKMQLAAMGRANIPVEDRKDFYLYVDEFQNFATDSFAVILSEARKYKLNLIMTNQYIAQIPEAVSSAVFGNVGTLICFRVGAGDASSLAQEFEPVFIPNDLVNLDNYHVYIKMAIDGITSLPFSARTLPPVSDAADLADEVTAASRRKYAHPRQQVEKDIAEAADMVLTQETVANFVGQAHRKLEKTSNEVSLGEDRYRKVVDSDNERWYYKITKNGASRAESP